MCVVKATLNAVRKDFGGYIIYVFKNLEPTNFTDKYIMTVRFPNWECPPVEIGDVGYLKFKEVEAGKDTWWNNGVTEFYKYDNVIFINFVHEVKDSTVIL